MTCQLPQGVSAFEPIGDQVAIKRDRPIESTPGGIALPQRSKEYRLTGTVVAVGPGALRAIVDPDVADDPTRLRFPMQVKVGDRVALVRATEGDRIRLDPADEDSEVIVCHEAQLMILR